MTPTRAGLHLVMVRGCLWCLLSPTAESGGQGRNRTTDTRIFSPLLYRLSYLATFPERERPEIDLAARGLPGDRLPRRRANYTGNRGASQVL